MSNEVSQAFLLADSLTSADNMGVEPLVHGLGHIAHPACLFHRFRDMPYPVLLDSSMYHPSQGRYSYLTADPFLVIRSRSQTLDLWWNGKHQKTRGDPWSILKEVLRRFRIPHVTGLPPFQGGAVGYLSYDLGRLIERLPSLARDDMSLPEMYLAMYDWAMAYDAMTGQSWLFSTGFPDGSYKHAKIRIAQVLRRLDVSGMEQSEVGVAALTPLKSNFTRESYMEAVRKVKEYLADGDVYQVNISQRLETTFSGDIWPMYMRLRQTNPAPFSAYLEFPEGIVLSTSPEEFLRLQGRRVETRPIKGTSPRGRTLLEDRRLSEELFFSEKDRAENVMIVDLLRSDLGRVCQVGSLSVPELFVVESSPTVHHLVSTVTGDLQKDMDAVDLLRASFPGGSVTGAPKIRAMEVIEELEPVRRGVYCGAIGYFSFSGDMNTSIVIRTVLATRGKLYLQVGGGIVADSDPEAEYEETLHKARGLRQAIEGYLQ